MTSNRHVPEATTYTQMLTKRHQIAVSPHEIRGPRRKWHNSGRTVGTASLPEPPDATTGADGGQRRRWKSDVGLRNFTPRSKRGRMKQSNRRAEMSDHDQEHRPVRRVLWARLLLVLPFITMLWVSSYNSAEPMLAGIPFFYWYQLLWILIGAALIAFVYVVER
jgi:hypothetical protein